MLSGKQSAKCKAVCCHCLDRSIESSQMFLLDRTIEGVCILECYRVTILHGSATFSVPPPGGSAGSGIFVSANGQAGPSDECLMAQLRWIMSTNPTMLPPEDISNPAEIYEMWSLCCLSLLLPWAAIKTTVQNDQPTFDYSRRREVLESALHRWFTITNDKMPIPTLMLFHMVSLNLHVSVSKIQNLARRHCGEPKPSPATTSSTGTGTLSSTDIFPSKIDQLNALWHAKKIIELAVNLRQDNSNSISIAEGPHFGYCVYFSALTLWYAEWQCLSADSEDPRSQTSVHDAAASLNKAIDVLSASPVQIAKRFTPTLQSLVGNVLG